MPRVPPVRDLHDGGISVADGLGVGAAGQLYHDASQLLAQGHGAALIAFQHARDLLAECQPRAVLRAAAHPWHPDTDQHPPPIDRHVCRHPLTERVDVPGEGATARALHRTTTGASANHDHLCARLVALGSEPIQRRAHPCRSFVAEAMDRGSKQWRDEAG